MIHQPRVDCILLYLYVVTRYVVFLYRCIGYDTLMECICPMVTGDWRSHMSKLAYYLMAGAKMRLPPFVSLDFPLSCDTIEDCNDDNIHQRYQGLQEMISHARECLRVGYGPGEQ
jgi:hypothetical protein